MSDTEALHRWLWEKTKDDDGITIQEFRLSVQSLLTGLDRERLDTASDVLSGVRDGQSKSWALDVMKDIFNRFGLDFRRSMYESSAGSKSMGDHSDGRSSKDQPSSDDEPLQDETAGEELQLVAVPSFTVSKLDVLMEDDEREDQSDHQNPEDDEDDDSQDEYPDWRTPPQSPPPSIEDRLCIPCNLRRFSTSSARRSSTSQKPSATRSIPSPPSSPPQVQVANPAPAALPQEKIPSHDKDEHARPPPHDAFSTRPKSFIKNLGKRIRTTSMKLRVSIINRAPPLTMAMLSPVLPPPIPKRSSKRNLHEAATTMTSASNQQIYGGPTLKLNRLSDVTLPLTPEERNEIARRRARESKLTEDFDLVVRLGTMRAGSRSSMAFTDGMDSVGEQVPVGANIASLPEIPMVEPEYLSKVTGADLDTERVPPRRRISSKFSTLSRRSSTKSNRSSSSPIPVVRNVLSESNLRIHTARTSSQRSTIEDSIPSAPPSRTSFRHRITPTPGRRSRSPSPAASLNRRVTTRRYPSMDYFPLAQTTALGLRGGKIGVVQMGSASKANKILGDVVLIVPEHQEREARKKRRRSFSRTVETIPSHAPYGSINKVERLRGEKLPVEPYSRWTSMTRRTSIAKSMEEIMETYEQSQQSAAPSAAPSEDKQAFEEPKDQISVQTSSEIKRTSQENMSDLGRAGSIRRRSQEIMELGRSLSGSRWRSTPENKMSVDYSLDGRVSRASSMKRSHSAMGQRASIDALRPKSNGAVWII
jgi:hypothetical protein